MKYIPWHNTQALAKGIAALNRMYNSLTNDSKLKLFLDKYCLHLLKPLEGHTSIPVSYSNSSVLKELPHVINLGEEFSPKSFRNLPKKLGVYVFFREEDNVTTQCEFSITFSNRIRTYYDEFKGLPVFSGFTLGNFKWVPVAYGNYYIEMFNLENHMTPTEEIILNSFTQQKISSASLYHICFSF